MRFSASGVSTDLPLVPIKVLRPLVFLVHGIWSCQNAWNNFTPLINDSRFFVQRADYRDLPVNTEDPCTASQDFTTNADRVYTQLKQRLSQYKTIKRIATTQADIIAHSMGAPVVRTMALKLDFLNDPKWFTFGGGPVHTLITIGGVHLGTPMANFVLANPCAANFFNGHGMPTGNGAVRDLAENSLAIQAINIPQSRTPFLAHTVAGVASDSQKRTANLFLNGIDLWYCRSGNVFRGVDSILGLRHDIMVSESSQLANTAQASTVYTPVTHSPPFPEPTELATPTITNRIIDLLNASEGSLFKVLP